MSIQSDNQANEANRNYEAELEFAQKKLPEYRENLLASEAQLMELEVKRGRMALYEPAADLSNIDSDIACARNKVQTWNDALQRVHKIIRSLERKDETPKALSEFDRLAEEAIEVAAEMGSCAGKIATLAKRGEESAVNLHRFISGLFPDGASFQKRWGSGELGAIVGDPDGAAGLRALEELSGAGEFVRSRMKSLRIVLDMELRNRC